MEAFIKKVSEEYDVIILDAPPILPVADSMVLSRLADGIILVIEYGKTTYETAVRSKENMENIGAKILGIVIKNIPIDINGGGYYYYSDEEYEINPKPVKVKKGLNTNV